MTNLKTPVLFLRRMTLTGALAATTALAVAPGVALAVPPGGYGDLVEAVSPSVVFIEVTTKAGPVEDAGALPEGLPEAFKRRFGQMMPDQGSSKRQGVGSGFIISETGEIVTNHHVVQGADSVLVKFADGRSLPATVVGSDSMTDIALLKVESDETLPVVPFGDSATVRAGDEVVAVGNPFGLGGTVTSGIVSATSRNIHSGPYDDFIQTDAAINRGNSGGPLFNAAGEVIGVNTAIFSPDGGSVGIGFAVPSDLVQTVVADLKDDGQITRGWLGVQIRPMSDEIASVLGYDSPKGAVIEAVTEGSPADKAGLIDGDIILAFNDTEISELRDLTRAVASSQPDKPATMTVLHKGETVTREVVIGTLQPQDA
ncbi:trypsin-like peptidase domain-containing protein [Sedimentitalea sp. JM2-8]|uniref:Probable periplasmic serine endoprotease DegP-like n=1 Tax=Sedimentitalea xiamensis TaxID=3050037 RepID=A0ABT7FF58_9RHOB|nr:trypsin-like peptidase domain-containing protein [Sedimentitalea xiamensis]MDK3073771.1 trypsin-like peptidase domain-containing protein [Sedimentitalea xiamensis]